MSVDVKFPGSFGDASGLPFADHATGLPALHRWRAESLTAPNGTRITSWSSDTGHALTAGSSTYQPVVTSAPDGRRVVAFDDTSENRMQRTTGFGTPSPGSYAFVFYLADVSAQTGIANWQSAASASASDGRLFLGSGGTIGIDFMNTDGIVSTDEQIAAGSWVIVVINQTGQMRILAGSSVTPTIFSGANLATGNSPLTALRIGRDASLGTNNKGRLHMAEMLLFQGSMDAAQMRTVYDALRAEYIS